ncbi:Na(+)/H(+) antiporter subunit D [Elusimicrobiota bacterium]
MNSIPPGLVFIIGAVVLPFLKGKIRKYFLLFMPVLAYICLINLKYAPGFSLDFLGYELILCNPDRLSMVFGYVFVLMSFIGFMYSLHLDECYEHVAGSLYIGSALGVVFCGDLITLFIFWEIMAFASAYLIWARRTPASEGAGFRYILVHIAGGLILFSGIVIRLVETGSISFELMALDGWASYLILIGFMLNAAVPPLSAWLSDAYPEATVTGAVFLSAFTTKTAVYVLIRGFAGTEILIWMGAIMAFYGVIFAVLANDIRRILAYHIISQVGYMVAGVGIGTALALNGSASHAFAHILYKGLLFMGAGAVIQMTGKSKLTELGGVYKTMPITLTLYMIGALSISAFPLFSGFVSKSMIVSAAANEHLIWVWLILSISSAGTFLHTGLKLPFFTFFGKDRGIRAKEPPVNMLVAMGVASFACVIIGVYPDVLYRLLPFNASYHPYTGEHVVWTLQVLLFTGLGFFLLLKHLDGEPYITADTDWFYRKGARAFMWFVNNPMAEVFGRMNRAAFETIPSALTWFSRNPIVATKIIINSGLMLISEPIRTAELRMNIKRAKNIYPGDRTEHWPIGWTVLGAVFFLFVYLVAYYL